MRTLIFPTETLDNRGGHNRAIIDMVCGLADNSEFNIIVLCPSGSEMSKVDFPSNVKVVTTPMTEWTLSSKSFVKTLKTIWNVYKVLKTLISKDTLVITNHSVTSAMLSLMPLKNINEIYINRGGDFKDQGYATRILLNKIRNNKIGYAVGISERQVRLLIDSGLPENRVFLIHDGLTLPNIPYYKENISRGLLRISIIGFLSTLKNQIEGVRLLKLLRDNGVNAILNLYGTSIGEIDYENSLTHLIDELNVVQYVHLHGFVTGEELFKDTDVIISFSKTEGFGRTLVEGMFRYKPVIAWRGAGGPVDITANGLYGYLVEQNDAQKYYKVIMRILNNNAETIDHLEKTYNYACSHFSVNSMIKKYKELFETICY